MMHVMKLLAISLLLLATRARAFQAIATMYRGTLGAAGTRLEQYPARVKLGSKSVLVYPVAVYTDRVNTFKYKVIRLENKDSGKTIYGHVTDECADGDCHENKSLAHRQGKVLIDVHQTAWEKLGLNSFGIHELDARVASGKRFSYKNSPGIRKLTTKAARRGWVPNKWKV